MISVIGAGPSGSYTAYLLARKGYNVCLFEEHSKIGRPVHCTGLVTSSICSILKIKDSLIKNRIRRIRAYPPGKDFLELNLRNPELVLDREKFDSYLCSKAVDAGANLFLNHRFIAKEKNRIIIKDTEKKRIKRIETDILIGADGHLSSVAKSSGLFGKREFYIGLQARVKLKTDPCCYKTFFGNGFPDFFGWVVPENDSIARVGLAAKRNSALHFKDFMASRKIKKEDIIEKQSGLIPVYNPKNRAQSDNVYIVGDAALQVKATTGGGIIPGLLAAKALANSIIKDKDYEKMWRNEIGKELFISLLIRKMLNKFSDEDYNKLISLAGRDSVKDILENHDRDHPSRMLLDLVIKEPRFFYFLKLMVK